MIMPLTSGMPGEPLPYLLHTDWIVTILLFLCTLSTCVVFSKEKKYLLQQLKASLTKRERSSMFDEVTSSDIHYKFLLIIHSCIFLAFCIYYYYSHDMPALFKEIPHGWLLAGYTLSIALLLVIKTALYQFTNWVFFQKARNSIWIKSFFNQIIWLGILMIPVVLVTVYFDISSEISLWTMGILIIFAKIALFWICFCNFFEKKHGAFHLILYFCALEILPDLIFWKGIEFANNNLILNI